MKTSIKKHFEVVHPKYTEEENYQFLRELYRLKGFAHLRRESSALEIVSPNNLSPKKGAAKTE